MSGVALAIALLVGALWVLLIYAAVAPPFRRNRSASDDLRQRHIEDELWPAADHRPTVQPTNEGRPRRSHGRASRPTRRAP